MQTVVIHLIISGEKLSILNGIKTQRLNTGIGLLEAHNSSTITQEHFNDLQKDLVITFTIASIIPSFLGFHILISQFRYTNCNEVCISKERLRKISC